MTEQLGVALREQAEAMAASKPAPAVGVIVGAARRRRRVRAGAAAALAVLILGGAGAVVAPGPDGADRLATVPHGEPVVPDEARLREAFRQLDPPVELGPATVEEDVPWEDGQVLRKLISTHDPGNAGASTPAVGRVRGSLSVDWFLVEPQQSDEWIAALGTSRGNRPDVLLETGADQSGPIRSIVRSSDDDLMVTLVAWSTDGGVVDVTFGGELAEEPAEQRAFTLALARQLEAAARALLAPPD